MYIHTSPTYICIQSLVQSDLCQTDCKVTSENNATALAQTQTCAVCFPDDVSYGCGGLGLTETQMVVVNAMGVTGTLLVRFISGPLVDRFGAKK